MHNKLQQIIDSKYTQVAELKAVLAPHADIKKLLLNKIAAPTHKSFSEALQAPPLSVIAEIKRHSPSKGQLATITDPTALAKQYSTAGASAVSVLTDRFFAGQINDLKQVSTALQTTPTTVLRKDFIVDPIQIAEASLAGADAVLLIVAVLGNEITDYLRDCNMMGVDALVEIHNEAELEIALAAEANIIGINNRDLTSFKVDTDNAFSLGEKIPDTIIKVAESGITDAKLAQAYHAAGFHAVLVGESLVTADNPGQMIKAMRGQDD